MSLVWIAYVYEDGLGGSVSRKIWLEFCPFPGMHSLGINGEGKSWGSLENGH